MTDPLKAILQSGLSPTSTFPASSRYSNSETATLDLPDGRTVIYLGRRFVPSASRFATQQEHIVIAGDRVDNLAAQFLGDPLLFWRLCDANTAMRPEELTARLGRVLRIPLPEGVTG
jgi:hypothetical protein